jgi:hypothetical protein
LDGGGVELRQGSQVLQRQTGSNQAVEQLLLPLPPLFQLDLPQDQAHGLGDPAQQLPFFPAPGPPLGMEHQDQPLRKGSGSGRAADFRVGEHEGTYPQRGQFLLPGEQAQILVVVFCHHHLAAQQILPILLA